MAIEEMMRPNQLAAPGKKVRLLGVDAARGLALLGMIAIHVMPGWDADYEPTTAWLAFAGRSAALFALLAGVSLAFSSGTRQPVSGPQLFAARASVSVRAVLIALLGLAMGYVVIEESVILAYYGVMFLLAVPFLGWSAKGLAYLSAGVAVLAPVLMQAARDSLPAPGYDPTFTTLITDPATALSQLFLTGTYPAIPWMAYIFAGMAIGRLDLRRRIVQIRLMASGIVVAVVTWAVSALLLGAFGGREALERAASAGNAAEIVRDTLIWGPDPTLPTDSWWWLTAIAPYSSTPAELVHTVGTSMAVLGAMLLLTSFVAAEITTLVAMGTMTLTLYTGHLLILATGMFEDKPGTAMFLHIAIVAVFALVWRRFLGQGPLEKGLALATGRAKSWALEAATRDAKAKKPRERGTAAGSASSESQAKTPQQPDQLDS